MTRVLHKFPHLLPALALFAIGAIAYLPNAGKFGFYNDEWYLMYAARVLGPEFFTIIFESDRPARAPLQFILYVLFGEKTLYYHISAYLFRSIGALAIYFVFDIFWPQQKRISLLAATLFLIYPGFLLQIYAVDFQAHIFSLMAAMLSVWFSIKSVLTSDKTSRFILVLFAILTGWGYVGLMEYLIGIEVFRFTLLAVLAHREHNAWRNKAIHFLHISLPFFLSLTVFLAWRFFIFQGEREATDIGTQLGLLFSQPTTGLWWLVHLLQDTISVVFAAWIVPFYNLVFSLRLRDFLFALFFGFLALAIHSVVIKNFPEQEPDNHQIRELFFVGGIAILGGLLPIILANRHVNFGGQFRYTLPALAGVTLIVVGGLMLIKGPHFRSILMAFLITTAIMSHYANSVGAAISADSTRNFWWQVSWRIPDMKPGTTLLVSYPNIAISEDYIIWGPANQIYAADSQTGPKVNVPFPALVLDRQTVIKVNLAHGQEERLRRGIFSQPDYRKVLILTQPTTKACVRVLDGDFPELSENDRLEIVLAASASRADGIILNSPLHTPPSAYFGFEPPLDWCYYYQKASLARQIGDWEAVIALGEQAREAGFYPSERIEWLPFMQAYVKLGQKDELKGFISIMTEMPFIQNQACTILSASTSDPDMLDYIQQSFCK